MLLPLASVFAGLAALVHVYIFVLESLRWTVPATRRIFGTTAETAEITRALAYNQGFYNLFLAIGTAIGIAFLPADEGVGVALIGFGTGSMLAAAVVLITSDRAKARPATIQGLLPALALLLLLVEALA